MAAAVGAAIIAGGVQVAVNAFAGAALFEGVLLAAGKAFVISGLSSALASKPAALSSSGEAQKLKQILRSSVAPHRIVYGQSKISGSLAYAGTSGADDGTLHLVVPFHLGEFDSVVSTYLSDDLIGADKFDGVASQTLYYGTADQLADAGLIAATSDWTSAHRLRGIGYSVLVLTWNRTAYPYGIPNPSWVMKGRKVWDPRSDETVWSDNWALCVLDYLIGTVPTDIGDLPIGVGATLDEINLDSFIAAADVADEDVALSAGGTQKRYTCNGVVDLSQECGPVMEKLLTAGDGALVHLGGVYSLYAGGARTGTFAITADMLRDGSIKNRPLDSHARRFNTVRGTYVDRDAYYEALDFVPRVDATQRAADGEEIGKDIDLPYTQDAIAAQRIAEQFLRRAAAARETLVVPLNWSGMEIAAWDTGTVTIAELGIDTDQKWRVTDWALAEGGGVDLVLSAEDDTAYDWTEADELAVSTPKKPTMADSSSVEDITGLTVDSASTQTSEGDYVGALYANWDNADSAYVKGYDVEVSEYVSQNVVWSGRATQSALRISALVIGVAYNVSVRAVRDNESVGAWSTVTNVTPSGDVVAPDVPSSISATPGSNSITVDWVNPADDDFRKVRLYRHTANDFSGASLFATIYGLPGEAGTKTDDTLTTGNTRYYWPISVDASGNASTTPTAVSATAL